MLSNRIKQVLIDKINFKRPAERPAEPIAVGQEVAYSDTDTESDSDTCDAPFRLPEANRSGASSRRRLCHSLVGAPSQG